MIKNEKQFAITKKRLRDFETSLKNLIGSSHPEKKLRIKIQADAIRSDIKALRSEVNEFEKLKKGQVKTLTAHSINELPYILIKARIARSMSQKDLAETLGLKEQQIQRYESNNYASASLSRIEKVVEALNINIEEKATLC